MAAVQTSFLMTELKSQFHGTSQWNSRHITVFDKPLFILQLIKTNDITTRVVSYHLGQVYMENVALNQKNPWLDISSVKSAQSRKNTIITINFVNKLWDFQWNWRRACIAFTRAKVQIFFIRDINKSRSSLTEHIEDYKEDCNRP